MGEAHAFRHARCSRSEHHIGDVGGFMRGQQIPVESRLVEIDLMERCEIVPVSISGITKHGHRFDNPHDVVQTLSWCRRINDHIDDTQEMGCQIEIDKLQLFLCRQQDVFARFNATGMEIGCRALDIGCQLGVGNTLLSRDKGDLVGCVDSMCHD